MTTELQPKMWSEEPVRQAASLLRRIAFFLLFGAAPAFSPYSRRSLVLFSIIGAALLVVAAVIDGSMFTMTPPEWTLPLATIFIAGFVYLFWSGLSLAWTPFPGESGGRYAIFVGILLVGTCLVAIMPRRVSASRLYILAGGVTIGFILCLGPSFAPAEEIDVTGVSRSLATLILLIPPVAVWLIYRRRDSLAILLVLTALLVTLLVGNFASLVALVAACAVFSASLYRPDQTRQYLALVLSALVLFSPFIPLIVAMPLRAMLGDDNAVAQLFNDWFRIIADEPFRLLTGHGFDTIWRAAAAGLIPPNAPRSILVDTWFELGMIGAVSLSALIGALVMASSAMTRPGAAAMQAVLVAAFVIGTFGGNLAQTMWLTSLVLAALAVTALSRGQYKTARPVSSDIQALNGGRSGFSIFPDRFRF